MVERNGSFFTTPQAKYSEKILEMYKDSNKNNKLNTHLFKTVEDEIRNNIQCFLDKIKNERKKNVQLRQRNQELVTENMLLLNKSTQMIQGCNKNLINPFPSEKDIKDQLNAFINIDLFKFFKHSLESYYNTDGYIFFFLQIFKSAHKKIIQHFQPLNNIIIKTLQMGKMVEPLDWILKKTSQANWKKILESIENKESYFTSIREIQNELSIDKADEQIRYLSKKALDTLFKCYIMNPRINYELEQIGQIIYYEDNICQPFESKIPKKTECCILIPEFYSIIDGNKVIIEKPKVLPKNY